MKTFLCIAASLLPVFGISFGVFVDSASSAPINCVALELDGNGTDSLLGFFRCYNSPLGRATDSEIILSKYIGNIDGKLTWNNTNFDKSCTNLTIAFQAPLIATLSADCKNAAGNTVKSSIVLSEHFGVSAGYPEYDGKLMPLYTR